MKVGFNMLLWTTHVTEEHLPLLQTLKDVGYDGVEMPLFEGDTEHFEKVGKAIKDNDLELTCWGDHFDVDKALRDHSCCKAKRALLKKHGLKVFAISTHLVDQAVCDNIDERHQAILPSDVWGDGDPEGVRKRAAQKIIDAAKTAKKLGVKAVNGFTGSSIWHMLYSFPHILQEAIKEVYKDFGRGWLRIIDAFKAEGVMCALDAYPSEVVFGINKLAYSGYGAGFMGVARMANHNHACTDQSHGQNGIAEYLTGCAVEAGLSNARKPKVFISYSHEDEAWKDQLVTQLRVLQKQSILDVWDDSRIGAGEDWQSKIEEAINGSSVAILMISPDSLSSQFILGKEVRLLLERGQKDGLHVFPIIVRPCTWKRVTWLSSMNVRPKDGKPISAGNEHQIDTDFSEIAEEVASIIDQDREADSGEGLLVSMCGSTLASEGDEVIEAVLNLYRAMNKYHISRGGTGFNVNFEINVTVN